MLATYNEAECIVRCLEAVSDAATRLAASGIETRVLLVDDESPDGTARLASEAADRLHLSLSIDSASRGGLGRAYLRGFAAIEAAEWADTIVTLDADGQHDPRQIPELVQARKQSGVDLMIGSRWARGAQVNGLSLTRRSISRFGNRLFAVSTGTRGVRDATTSYRVFSRSLVRTFDPGPLSVSGYSFFSSFVGVAAASGLRVGEYPIVFAPRSAGTSKLQLRDVFQFVRNLPLLRKQLVSLRRDRRTVAPKPRYAVVEPISIGHDLLA